MTILAMIIILLFLGLLLALAGAQWALLHEDSALKLYSKLKDKPGFNKLFKTVRQKLEELTYDRNSKTFDNLVHRLRYEPYDEIPETEKKLLIVAVSKYVLAICIKSPLILGYDLEKEFKNYKHFAIRNPLDYRSGTLSNFLTAYTVNRYMERTARKVTRSTDYRDSKEASSINYILNLDAEKVNEFLKLDTISYNILSFIGVDKVDELPESEQMEEFVEWFEKVLPELRYEGVYSPLIPSSIKNCPNYFHYIIVTDSQSEQAKWSEFLSELEARDIFHYTEPVIVKYTERPWESRYPGLEFYRDYTPVFDSFALYKLSQIKSLEELITTCKDLCNIEKEELPTFNQWLQYLNNYEKYETMPVSWWRELL